MSVSATTIVLAASMAITLPALATGVTVKANAATSGHKFTAIDW